MDKSAAEKLAERFNREHPERESHTWFARETDGEWSVVKVAVSRRDEPQGAVVEELERKKNYAGQGGYDHVGGGHGM